jgi:urea transport system permease protein
MERAPRRSLMTPRGWLVFLAFGFALVVLLPVLNRVVATGSFAYVPDYLIPLIGKYCTYAMLALAMDLIWGYAGILSLGQGAFFALGGYCMGMYLMRQIGARGVYKNANLPDFMVFLNWKELPWYWEGFDMFWFAAIMIVVIPGLLALIIGWLTFRSRVTGVYLSIITQAMTFALLLAFFRNNMGFGGNNGLTDFKDILGLPVQAQSTRVTLLIASGIGLGATYLICRWIVNSKLGRVLLAVRDAESRVRFIGYSVTNAKLFVFVVAAMLSGVAGALYVPQVGIINPGEFSPANSIEIALWVAVGGRGTLAGAVIGAFLVNMAKTWLTGAMPEVWLFFLGLLFIVVTLLFPRGVVGLVADQRERWRARAAGRAADAAGATT